LGLAILILNVGTTWDKQSAPIFGRFTPFKRPHF